MPDLFTHWGVARNEGALVERWALNPQENTELSATRRRAREYLKKLVLRNQNSNLQAAVQEMVDRLNTLIANKHYEYIDRTTEYLRRKLADRSPNVYGNNEKRLKRMAEYFEPIVVARRGLQALTNFSARDFECWYNNVHSDWCMYNLSLIVYMAEANNASTYKQTYNAGDIVRGAEREAVLSQHNALYQDILADPMDYRKLCAYGRTCLQLGDPNEAIEYFDRALTVNEYYEEAYNGKGMAYAELADVNKIQSEINDLRGLLANYEADLVRLLASAGLTHGNAVTSQEDNVLDLRRYIEEIASRIATKSQQLARAPEYSATSKDNFVRAHLELKKNAFLNALHQSTRGNNFNVDEADVLRYEDFLPDSKVCHNGHVNKFAEYFGVFEEAAIAGHADEDLYKALVTQAFKSYQRLHMENGSVKAHAPTLMDYAAALEAYYSNPNHNENAILRQEFSTIWANISHIFHGVHSHSNPQGLLKPRDVTLLDTAAKMMSELIEAFGEDCQELAPDENLRKFQVIAARDERFNPNPAQINADSEMSAISTKCIDEVLPIIPLLSLRGNHITRDLRKLWQLAPVEQAAPAEQAAYATSERVRQRAVEQADQSRRYAEVIRLIQDSRVAAVRRDPLIIQREPVNVQGDSIIAAHLGMAEHPRNAIANSYRNTNARGAGSVDLAAQSAVDAARIEQARMEAITIREQQEHYNAAIMERAREMATNDPTIDVASAAALLRYL